MSNLISAADIQPRLTYDDRVDRLNADHTKVGLCGTDNTVLLCLSKGHNVCANQFNLHSNLDEQTANTIATVF